MQLRASSPWHCLAPTLGRVGGDGQGLAHPTYPQEDLLGPGWRLPNWCPDQLSWPAKNPSSSQKVARPTDKTRGPTSKWKGPGARSWHPVLRASSLCQFGGSHKATGPSSAVLVPADSGAGLPQCTAGIGPASAFPCVGGWNRSPTAPLSLHLVLKVVTTQLLGGHMQCRPLRDGGPVPTELLSDGDRSPPHSSAEAVARSVLCPVLAEMSLVCGFGSWAKTNTS